MTLAFEGGIWIWWKRLEALMNTEMQAQYEVYPYPERDPGG